MTRPLCSGREGRVSAVYNENDAYPAAWLRNLIAAGHIAPGTVDERSIVDLEPSDLDQLTQFHAFAGIGVWSHALRLAGWADNAPVWTGSCPCQPFSAAGRRKGAGDERHLWPAWFSLIRECRPPVVFGEQVANGDGLAWLDAVQADLEGEGYAVGALDLCAAGVGAPHIRQRIFFVADATGQRRAGERLLLRAEERRREPQRVPKAPRSGEAGLVADARRHECAGRDRLGEGDGAASPAGQEARIRTSPDPGDGGAGGLVGDTNDEGLEGRDERGNGAGELPARPPSLASFWSASDWLQCRDGKARPVEPGTFPLAHGVAGRVGRLRAYGNAIIPQVAAEFVRAYMAVSRPAPVRVGP